MKLLHFLNIIGSAIKSALGNSDISPVLKLVIYIHHISISWNIILYILLAIKMTTPKKQQVTHVKFTPHKDAVICFPTHSRKIGNGRDTYNVFKY